MKLSRLFTVAVLLLLSVFWIACGGHPGTNGRGINDGNNGNGSFLLIADSANNKLISLPIAANASISATTSTAINTEAQPNAIVVSGNRVYVTASGSTNVNAFNLSITGALSAIGAGSFAAGLNPNALVFAPNGQLVVANGGASTLSLEVVDISGALAQINTAGLNSAPRSLTVAGGFVWVATGTGIQGFLVANNALTPLTFGTFNSTNIRAIAGFGNFLYAADTGSNVIRVFSVDTGNGQLTESATTYAVGTEPVAMTFDPAGKFLYVVNRTSATVSAFTVNTTTGALTSVGSVPTGGNTPSAMAFDPIEFSLYVANTGSGTVQAYSVNATTGVLTAIGTAVSVGGQPTALAVAKP